MKKKFGALPQALEDRLDIATEQQLEQCSEAVLTAQTIDDIFAVLD